MDAADSSSTEVSRVAVQLPPFWPERPAMWFAQAEAQFTLASINSEHIKFCHVISQLDHRYAAEVEDIITGTPQRWKI
jgi:tagatose-1,6-bisphosphate aldolase non-catalytic subunit AgaZ/GatZ